MYRVALTGNIASGKSAVAEEWRGLGACIIDADVLARRAVEPGSAGLARIAQVFGDDVIVGGALDRAALGRVVFGDAARRRELEAIVHPEVERLRTEEEAVAAQRGESIVVHAIPLLFETGLDSQFDTVVLVDADENTRRERLVTKRALRDEDARAMIAAQAPAGPKRARADFVIDNNGTLDDLARRAREVWREILAAAA
ncbi:MAG TPA: dephospho-CoA kinase [Longimicrobiales bacterium]|nr:dephospho-CoA kinase [Longimicrobiales bacterium]